jgi:hypothetical protein
MDGFYTDDWRTPDEFVPTLAASARPHATRDLLYARAAARQHQSGKTTAADHAPHGDGRKLALCIEDGGMRGAVSAGMALAVQDLGLGQVFDVVYGNTHTPRTPKLCILCY